MQRSAIFFCQDFQTDKMKKAISLHITLLTVIALLTIVSCTRTVLSSTELKSSSITGDWVLKYSISASIRTDYPQDEKQASTFGYPSWASHLKLIKNDSAYWNNCGIDTTPEEMFSGVYSTSNDSTDNPKITLTFQPGDWRQGTTNTFEYSLASKDTLKLRTTDPNYIEYTYYRN